jgi:hypothetical protein
MSIIILFVAACRKYVYFLLVRMNIRVLYHLYCTVCLVGSMDV